MNAVDDLSADCLGHAGLIYEYTLVGVNSSSLSFLELCPLCGKCCGVDLAA